MSIFGIPDRSQKVTWRILLAAAAFTACMLAMNRYAPEWRSVVIWGLLGLPVAVVVLLVAWAFIFRRHHPASRIAVLLQAKKIDEACSLAASLLEKTPDDLLVQLNGVAAYVAAGNLERARQVLGTIQKDRLQGVMLKAHAQWEEKLNPARPA